MENLWKEDIESTLLGHSEGLSDERLAGLDDYVQKSPSAVFALLNKEFNKQGFCIQIKNLG